MVLCSGERDQEESVQGGTIGLPWRTDTYEICAFAGSALRGARDRVSEAKRIAEVQILEYGSEDGLKRIPGTEGEPDPSDTH